MLHFLFAIAGFAFANPTDTIAPTKRNHPETNNSILFSGYEWKVRNSPAMQGPGPNYFSEKAAWLDDQGFLHLSLHKDSASGNWLCPEVTSSEHFGYGTYSFEVEGTIDKFNKNIVLGLFNYSGNDGLDEMDIEVARWGNDSFPNLNYTVWPAKKIAARNATHAFQYAQESKFSIQQFTRSADSVAFSTFNGAGVDSKKLVASYVF